MAKLVLQILEEEIPNRIAIHTSLESYRFVYFVNRNLNTCFCRLIELKDLSMYRGTSGTDTFFEVFRWEDKLNDRQWICIKNKLIEQSKGETNSLFEMVSSVSYWDKNHIKADFILEIEDVEDYSEMEDLCLQLENIPGVLSTQII